MKPFTKKELYYIAGLLEGEGSFCIYTNPKSGVTNLSIKIKMTDKDVIEWVAEKWEGNVYLEEHDNHWKTAYIAQLRRQKECIKFLRLIEPLMFGRRKEKIAQILEQFKKYWKDRNVT